LRVIPEVLATIGLYYDMGEESNYSQGEKRVLIMLLTNTTYDYGLLNMPTVN
jgi:hypothetical protein